MAEAYNLFSTNTDQISGGVSYKSFVLKRRILASLAESGLLTMSELATEMGVSTPTISKLLSDLITEGYVQDMGKVETPGGRRPCGFSLIGKAGYFMGIEMEENCLRFALVDMNRNIVGTSTAEQPQGVNTNETIDGIIEKLLDAIKSFGIEKHKLLGVGLILRGRVDSVTGHSYSYLHLSDKKLSQVLTEKLGIRTIIENDTRAATYAEHVLNPDNHNLKNSLFLYVGRGVGVGIIINGELYYGKSGFSGEFGHIPFFENQIICHCGKKGCLETEASGTALERTFTESLRSGASSILSNKFATEGRVTLTDIIQASAHDDVLSIELIGEVGEKLGRGIGVLINLFNPESVIIGGALAEAGDYLILPLRAALAKYSLSLVNNDSTLRVSKVGQIGPVVGGALLTRNHILKNK